jgi:ABC-2 type transport system ATP-binding protein
MAVGDRRFKEKCHQRIDEITRDGRTVLLVSHALDSVLRMCERALILEGGRVAYLGSSADATTKYAAIGAERPTGERGGSGELRIAQVLVSGSAGEGAVHVEGDMRIAVELETTRPVDPSGLTLKLGIHARRGVLGQLSTQTDGGPFFDREVQSGDVLTCDIDRVPLKPGEYWLSARLERMGELVDELERCGSFWVVAGDSESGLPPTEGDPGFLVLRQRWTVSEPLQSI